VQVGLVVGVDGGEPVVVAVAVQAGEDLGELGDVAGARVLVRAVLPGPGEFLLFLVVEVVRVDEDQLARSRALAVRGRWWGGAGFPEGRDVAADSAVSVLPDGASGGAGRRGTPSFASRPRQPQGCLPGRPRTGGAC
jgi:hypothetical protein